MSFPDKGNSESVEALISTLNMDNTSLQEANLSTLSSSDLEQFAELSQSLNMSSDMDNQASEEEIVSMHIEEAEEEELVETELGAQEIEIETEHDNVEDIILETKPKTVPPLRPLNVAPKPAKLPIAIKPVAGQQLLFVQGNGQQFKLLSPQTINLSNLQLGKPLAIKPAGKTITTSGTLQPKQVVMKKVIQPVMKSTPMKTYDNKQVVVVQKSDTTSKITQVITGATSTPTKTITLAQAQQMGLLPGTKIISQGSGLSKQTILLNKSQQKGIRLVRSPAKVLPAPQTSSAVKQPQRVLLKSTTSPTLLSPSQLIQMAGSQPISAGQIHQINIPGKGVQYIKFVTTQADSGTITTSSTTTRPSHTVNIGSKIVTLGSNSLSDGNIVLSEVKPIVKNIIAPKIQKPSTPVQQQTLVNNSAGQLLMVPASYLQRSTSTPKIPIPIRSSVKPMTNNNDAVVPVSTETLNLESNGMRPRKPCNCTKSQCLKLYCDCFANGEFCYMCNCMNCFNNLENEEHRQRAIKNCLDRNPNAFRPKIGKSKDTGDTPVRKHTKGCNCKRSGCLKNYCECYEAKIACSSNCKCIGCRNIEDTMDKKNVRPQSVEVVFGRVPTQPNKIPAPSDNIMQLRPKRVCTSKQALNNINVIEATTQCLLAVAAHSESIGENDEDTKGRLIEEFGKCLIEIINSSKTKQHVDSV